MPVPACLFLAVLWTSCSPALPDGAPAAPPGEWRWERLTSGAAFPPSYNFPVFVAKDGRFVALHSQGTWISRDGTEWTPGTLPPSGMNAAYLSYVEHDGAAWTLGRLEGDYRRFRVEPLIRRTADFATWETVGRSATLPQLVFYAAGSFRGYLWMLGGWDGTRERAEVWRSRDGLAWERVLERAPWAPRSGARAIVWRDRLWVLGGQVIDGAVFNDAWSSADGVTWVQETGRIARELAGGTPVVFRDRLWLVGANRSGQFSSALLVTDDGRTWTPQDAPWPPRGAAAAWTHGEALYLTGGKYSTVRNGETVFEYRNDVWRLAPVR